MCSMFGPLMTRYGILWRNGTDPAIAEADMYLSGGYKVIDGEKRGNGALFHFKKLISEL